ncbi:hypothetical protein ILUMI_00140 [Ignelater luminosus]|uniref:Uncharacterized protein n=1 Tax=Ignelater luminosus TaxID=2038154 RepID=A0A8K0DL25_IGNLU|nr:hypothetical protein ILUMI_00140 [Ignelater luminosus]
MLERIISLLSIKKIECEQVCECTCSLLNLQKKHYDLMDNSILVEPHSFTDSNRTIVELQKQSQRTPVPQYRRHVGQSNPYLNFFRRSEETAAIWYPKSTPQLDSMPLIEKAKIVTELIAIDFVKWLRRLQGMNKQSDMMNSESVTSIFIDAFGMTARDAPNKNDKKRDTRRFTRPANVNKIRREDKRKQVKEEPSMDISEVMKMFEIGVNNEAATSMAISVKEISSVSKSIADYQGIPEVASRRQLHSYLEKDIKQSRKKPKSVAFGRCLPNDLRYKPASLTYSTYKFQAEQHKKKITTLKRLWNSISDLHSARSYACWLMGHPEICAPNLLLKLYLETEKSSHHSRESQTSVGSRATHMEEVNFKMGQIIPKKFK